MLGHMPNYTMPGLFTDETSVRFRTVTPADPAMTIFVGPSLEGKLGKLSAPIHSFSAYKKAYGGSGDLGIGRNRSLPNYLALAVHSFFREGGDALRIIRVAGGNGRTPSLRSYRSAIRRLARTPGLLTIAVPGSAALPALAQGVRDAMLDLVTETAPRCFALFDPEPELSPGEVMDLAAKIDTPDGALYYPWVSVSHPNSGRVSAAPPSATVAGVLARGDRSDGPLHSVGNEQLMSVSALERRVNVSEAEALNLAGIGALRQFPSRGVRVWGGRTLSSHPDWSYVNLRRYFAHLERSISDSLSWTVFEPNAGPLWAQVRHAVEGFLLDQWRAGRLKGSVPDHAYFVKCDRSTMIQTDIDAGRLITLIGFAPNKPSEFVVFRIVKNTA